MTRDTSIALYRAPRNRRSWLFLPGADAHALRAAPALGVDVAIQELEAFVPPARQPEARALSAGVLAGWRAAGLVSAVRVNPLDKGGLDDLAAAMPGAPHVVMMSLVSSADQVHALAAEVGRLEAAHGLPAGSTELVPNIETAAGLVRTLEIAQASPRVTAALVAAEDMVADLGAERSPTGEEVAYPRQRFLVDCVAAGVVAIDCPDTYADVTHLEADIRFARRLGYTAKSIVNIDQIPLVNRLLTPAADEIDRARRIVSAFDHARQSGADRAEVDGLMVEVPTYNAAQRVLQRARDLGVQD
jgi:citrate lyase subunit beta/citryl-CoA lyase